MKKLNLNDFEDLVFDYGINGNNSKEIQNLSDYERQVVALAWRNCRHAEDAYQIDGEAVDFCEQAYDAIDAWFGEFRDAIVSKFPQPVFATMEFEI